MVRRRRGATTMGCLFMALVLIAAVYFGLKIGKVFWASAEFEDAMKQQIRFAELLTDDQIYKRLVAKADSLGLPEDAQDVTVERTGRHISVSADYVEMVELPLHVRSFHFTPKAEYDY
jgi:hypothetical protein